MGNRMNSFLIISGPDSVEPDLVELNLVNQFGSGFSVHTLIDVVAFCPVCI